SWAGWGSRQRVSAHRAERRGTAVRVDRDSKRSAARAHGRRPELLGELDVLAARTLRPLSLVERDLLPFTKLVEGCLAAGLMEKVFASVACRDEPESFVVDQPLDCARRRHVVSCRCAAVDAHTSYRLGPSIA